MAMERSIQSGFNSYTFWWGNAISRTLCNFRTKVLVLLLLQGFWWLSTSISRGALQKWTTDLVIPSCATFLSLILWSPCHSNGCVCSIYWCGLVSIISIHVSLCNLVWCVIQTFLLDRCLRNHDWVQFQTELSQFHHSLLVCASFGQNLMEQSFLFIRTALNTLVLLLSQSLLVKLT